MKVIRLSLIILGLLTFSCNDFLDEEVISGISYSHYETVEGIESGMGGAYNFLRGYYNNERYFEYHVVGTDIFMEGRDTKVRAALNRYESSLNSTYSTLYDHHWSNYYQGISTANFMLDAIKNYEGNDMSSEFKTVRSAELYFLRGLYYFSLVQTFGKIPLVTESVLEVRTDFERVPVAEVYNFIISDLRTAVNNLPESQPEYGRATKGAAQHLLALVYLTRGSAVTDQRGQKPTDMDSAAYFADQVIASDKYQLLADFKDLWDINNQKNQEVIFAVQFSTTALYNNNDGNMIHLLYNFTYDLKPGMKRTIEYGRPWNEIRPTDYTILELFDRKNDSRFYKTFQTVFYSNNPDNLPIWEAIGDFAPEPELLGKPKLNVGDTSIWITAEVYPEDTNFDSLYASRPYYYMPMNRQDNANFFTLRKFLDPTRLGVNDADGFRDGILFRLGETYLIAAEAYGRKGDFETAVKRLNKIRKRAAYKTGEFKPVEYWKIEGGEYADREKSTVTEMLLTVEDLTNETSFVDFMLEERAREMAGEISRRWALLRTEKLVERVRKYNPYAADNIKEYHRLMPIPQQHIDRLDPKGPIEEEQNEGYY